RSSAPPIWYTSWAYALFSSAERDTRPALYIGLVRASELDLEMTVLSRSKNAASIAAMVSPPRAGPTQEMAAFWGTLGDRQVNVGKNNPRDLPAPGHHERGRTATWRSR